MKRMNNRLFLLTFACLLLGLSICAQAEFASVTALDSLTTSANTGEKPQSKVWEYDGQWWCVLPSSSASSSGTWIWKLDGTTWVEELQLSDETGTVADVKVVGNVVHVLLYDSDPELVSVEYSGGSYQLWSTRSTAVSIPLPSSEIATIDIDSTGRMWLSTESSSNVVVYHSDSPYSTWNGPFTLATGISSDDITVITALPDNTVGVLWSNQATQRFGFRVHADGNDPNVWSADEVPASQSALSVGLGMADDHLNVAVASDATLYAAVKTSYDTAGYPKIALLIRRPNASWDNLYEVDTAGTRGIAVLNESESIITVVYTLSEGNNNIVYKQSPTSSISLGTRTTLISGSNNNVSSSKDNVTDDVVILASSGSAVASVLATFSDTVEPPDANLVAYYMMEENGGSVLVDSSVYDNNAIISGSPGWVAGIEGLALDLDGINDYAVVTDDASLDITGSITLATWMKPEKVGTQRLIRKVGTGSGYSLFLSANEFASIRFNGNNSYRVDTAAFYPADGTEWMHIAATYDGTTIRTYINGTPDNTLATPFTIVANNDSLGIGAGADGSSKLQGHLDEARIYNRALDANEIEALATVAEPPAVADFAITKDDGQTQANPGDPITYTIVVSNNGPDDANGATVIDNFPAELTSISWSTVVSRGASSTQGSGTTDINDVVNIPNGGTVTYTVNATIDSGASGTLSNTATVTAPEDITDPALGNNSAADSTALLTGSEDPNLVAYYMMEENGGTVLVDSSTYDNSGTLSGDPGWTTGIDGLAIDLDGAGDYGLTPDDPNLDITKAITIAVWIRPGKVGTQYLVKKAIQSNTDGYELSLSATGKVFTRFNQNTSGNSYRIDTTSSYPTDGSTWVHLAATYDGSTIKIYFDGDEETTLPATFTIATNSLALGIGTESDGTDNFQGLMDEARLYNRALTLPEIKVLAGKAPSITADIEITKDDGLTDADPCDPVVYTIVVSNNGPNDVNAVTVTDTLPDEVTSISWSTEVSGGASSTQGSGTGDINDLVNLPNGGSVTYTVNGTFGGDVSGIVSNTAEASVPDSVIDPESGNNSATDVTTVYAQGDPNLVVHYQFEEDGGTDLIDASIYQNDAAIYGSPEWVCGPDGLALDIDGVSDYALAPDDPSLDITDQITIAAWLKPEQQTTQDLVKKATIDAVDGFELTLAAPASSMPPLGDGRVFVRFNQATSGNNYRLNSVTIYPFDGNSWIHVATTYDANTIRFYYNGVEEANLPAAITIATNDLALSIGAQNDGTRKFLGQMDDARVYNRALDANEIWHLSQPDVIKAGGDRLVELQNDDGGWDIPLDDGDPCSTSEPDVLANIATGLIKAYAETNEPNMLAALENVKTFLLNKTDDFEALDGYLAVELDKISGGTACSDYVTTNFFDTLAAGTYYDSETATTHDTASFVQSRRDLYSGTNANLAALNMAENLVGVVAIGADDTDWLAALKAEINEIDSNLDYDVLALAGAVFALATAQQDFDPNSGAYADANNINDLADSLVTYQLASGGFTRDSNSTEAGNESIQETAYAVLALNEVDRGNYWTQIESAGDYLRNSQFATGGWQAYEASTQGENNVITGQALWAIVVGKAALGDLEPDGDVDFSDYALFAVNWQWEDCCRCEGADLTGDFIVDIYDLIELTDNWLSGK